MIAVLAERPLHQEQRLAHYVNIWWWNAAWLLAVPVFLTARRWPWTALPLVIVSATPQWVVARVVKIRFYRVLEGGEVDLDFALLAYALATVMTCVFVVAAYTGTRRHQRPSS